MALNIKNERVHALAREAAQRTGQTQTSALEAALEMYLAHLDLKTREQDVKHRVDVVMNLVKEFNAHLTDEDRAAMKYEMEHMYDYLDDEIDAVR
ncbi:MAG: type II toxin-antitoxin system VapB family antitoxin [Dermatophilus congolensis]|nr:type II toxin-antitoxin system VapB family antitoxin [Dermatophilus congolensis]